jgi:pimeloyl-ACP methyl ester carboxylesterase
MNRVLTTCIVTVILIVGASVPVFATHSPNAAAEQLGVSNGAEYAMFFPKAWNGRLVLWAHGFVDPNAPIALPDVLPADVAPWLVRLREALLDAGYAVAYSSYAENGWAVKDGAARTHELRTLFAARFGIPTHVYVGGRSLGALITALLAETYPGDYQGALALCGPLGGGRLETDYIANVRVLFDFFFPGVIPGDAIHVPPMEFSADSPIVKAIVAAILAEPHKAVELASVDQIELPYRTLSELVLSIVRPLGYNIRGTNDLLARTGGQSPFGNLTTWYTGLALYDPVVNAGVGRFAAKDAAIRYLNDYYRPRGILTMPLLTLHTTMDPDVPFFHEAALTKIVAAGRTSKWLAQQSVQRYGHCNVTPAEVVLTLGRLVNWAEKGEKPASGDVTLQLAIESPESAASVAQGAIMAESSFTKAILSATTGLPLP